MDKRPRDIPFGKVRVDDILISCQDDVSHLKNLQRVFTALDKAGIKLRRSKCKFLLAEVTYLDFKINEESPAPLPEKVATMTEALLPMNVIELKAYCRK